MPVKGVANVLVAGIRFDVAAVLVAGLLIGLNRTKVVSR